MPTANLVIMTFLFMYLHVFILVATGFYMFLKPSVPHNLNVCRLIVANQRQFYPEMFVSFQHA